MTCISFKLDGSTLYPSLATLFVAQQWEGQFVEATDESLDAALAAGEIQARRWRWAFPSSSAWPGSSTSTPGGSSGRRRGRCAARALGQRYFSPTLRLVEALDPERIEEALAATSTGSTARRCACRTRRKIARLCADSA